MTATQMAQIPAFLSHLKIYNGYAVPFIQMWIDGKPDFRVVDPAKVLECVNKSLCAICGVKLGEFCYFIGGDLSKDNQLFADPPMHEQCAEFASKTCPFVSGKRQEYSNRPVDTTVARIEVMASSVRPKQMYILRTRTKKIGLVNVNGRPMIQAWIWSRVMEIGKETTPEMQESVQLLLKSKKFLDWKLPTRSLDDMEQWDPAFGVDNRHFKPEELAEAWGVSTETIRSIFREEPGVLKIGNPATRSKRGYFTLRIPEEVAERVHRRLSA
jgi:hypothetical protein